MLMQKIRIILFLFLVLPAPSILWSGQFKVTRVYDGDTLGVGGRGIELKVRLAGIDAPEISRSTRDPDQPYSYNAKRYLADLVLNKTVSVDRYGLDSDDRVIGVVYVGTKNVNLEMIKAGLAEVYQGMPPKGLDLGAYRREEKKAREAGKGMWALGNRYISPKDWHKIRRNYN